MEIIDDEYWHIINIISTQFTLRGSTCTNNFHIIIVMQHLLIGRVFFFNFPLYLLDWMFAPVQSLVVCVCKWKCVTTCVCVCMIHVWACVWVRVYVRNKSLYCIFIKRHIERLSEAEIKELVGPHLSWRLLLVQACF